MMMVSSTVTNTMSIFNINQASLGFHLYTPLSPLMIISDIVVLIISLILKGDMLRTSACIEHPRPRLWPSPYKSGDADSQPCTPQGLHAAYECVYRAPSPPPLAIPLQIR